MDLNLASQLRHLRTPYAAALSVAANAAITEFQTTDTLQVKISVDLGDFGKVLVCRAVSTVKNEQQMHARLDRRARARSTLSGDSAFLAVLSRCIPAGKAL
jgi:hypothetical protein